MACPSRINSFFTILLFYELCYQFRTQEINFLLLSVDKIAEEINVKTSKLKDPSEAAMFLNEYQRKMLSKPEQKGQG